MRAKKKARELIAPQVPALPAPDLQDAVSAIADELAAKAQRHREESRLAREPARASGAESASGLAGDAGEETQESESTTPSGPHPSPLPEGAGTRGDTEIVDARWQQVLSIANEEAHTVAPLLTPAMVSITPDAVILRYPHDAAINARMLEKESRRIQILPILARVFGHELHLIVEVEDAPEVVEEAAPQVRKPKKPRLDEAPTDTKAKDPTDVPASAATKQIDPKPYEADPLVQAFLKAFDGRVVKAEKE